MKRDAMKAMLEAVDFQSRLPVWIISYNRAGTAPLLNRMRSFTWTEEINILVRESQKEDYKKAYPELTIHSLPDSRINAVGLARQGAADLAYTLGYDRILMMDDDVTEMETLFEGEIKSGPNKGKKSSVHSPTIFENSTDRFERTLTAFSNVAEEVFEAHPDAVIGGAIKRHMSFAESNQSTKYVLNGRVTPRQVMAWDIQRMMEMGISINPEHFALHGDDIGLVVTALAVGADAFAAPTFIYEHWPESINITKSVVRNEGNAAELHELEWQALQQYPAKDYLRVKRSIIDGSFEWAEVNWQSAAKLRGRPMIKVAW